MDHLRGGNRDKFWRPRFWYNEFEGCPALRKQSEGRGAWGTRRPPAGRDGGDETTAGDTGRDDDNG